MVQGALVLAGTFCILAGLAYAFLRHVYLAALVTAAPICVTAAFFVLPNPSSAVGMVLAVYLGTVCTFLIYDRLSRLICAGEPARAAATSARNEISAAAAPILMSYILALLALAPEWVSWTWRAVDAVVVVIAFAVSLALGTAANRFSYSEEFIARANAARERRERLFERPSGLWEIRWSLSVGGIALVLAAVALFGLRALDFEIDLRRSIELAGSAIVLAAAFAVITRNWRLTAAATFAAMLAALLAGWVRLRIGLPELGALDLWFAIILELIPLSVFVLRLSRHVNDGETPPAAIALTLREQGPATCAAFLIIALLALADTVRLSPFLLFYLLPAVAGLAAALLFFPAFGNLLYWLLPRYRSVDEVFGKR